MIVTKPMYTLKYRCRMCGEEYTIGRPIEFSKKFAKQDIEEIINSNQSETDMMIAHRCQNGNIGVADLIGYEVSYWEGITY